MSGDPGAGPRAPSAASAVDARRLEGGSARPAAGEFSYTVVAPAPPRRSPPPAPEPAPRSSASTDKRVASRQRTRLRTGKIIDHAGRFITECLVFDRSDTGSRLRLPAGVTLTASTIQFYDDQHAALSQADVVWRTEREVGIRYRAAPQTAQSRALADEMKRRFYAVPK